MKWFDRTWGQLVAFVGAAGLILVALARQEQAIAPALLACALLATGVILRVISVWRRVTLAGAAGWRPRGL